MERQFCKSEAYKLNYRREEFISSVLFPSFLYIHFFLNFNYLHNTDSRIKKRKEKPIKFLNDNYNVFFSLIHYWFH